MKNIKFNVHVRCGFNFCKLQNLLFYWLVTHATSLISKQNKTEQKNQQKAKNKKKIKEEQEATAFVLCSYLSLPVSLSLSLSFVSLPAGYHGQKYLH